MMDRFPRKHNYPMFRRPALRTKGARVHPAAKDLMKRGRFGDDELLHINKDELKGLASLIPGGITTNPTTGLPEAFKLGKALPWIAAAVGTAAALYFTGGLAAPAIAGASGAGAAGAGAAGAGAGLGSLAGSMAGSAAATGAASAAGTWGPAAMIGAGTAGGAGAAGAGAAGTGGLLAAGMKYAPMAMMGIGALGSRGGANAPMDEDEGERSRWIETAGNPRPRNNTYMSPGFQSGGRVQPPRRESDLFEGAPTRRDGFLVGEPSPRDRDDRMLIYSPPAPNRNTKDFLKYAAGGSIGAPRPMMGVKGGAMPMTGGAGPMMPPGGMARPMPPGREMMRGFDEYARSRGMPAMPQRPMPPAPQMPGRQPQGLPQQLPMPMLPGPQRPMPPAGMPGPMPVMDKRQMPNAAYAGGGEVNLQADWNRRYDHMMAMHRRGGMVRRYDEGGEVDNPDVIDPTFQAQPVQRDWTPPPPNYRPGFDPEWNWIPNRNVSTNPAGIAQIYANAGMPPQGGSAMPNYGQPAAPPPPPAAPPPGSAPPPGNQPPIDGGLNDPSITSKEEFLAGWLNASGGGGEKEGGLIRRRYAEGGPVDPAMEDPAAADPAMDERRQTTLIEMTRRALMGEVKNPEGIIALFIQTFGEEAFNSLRQKVTAEMGDGGQSPGGYLTRGPGDGMSDSIPAQIDGAQPARLSDGEFVVPADVVSHLGNGSTQAGARQLHGMMDRVRMARGGSVKQPPMQNMGRMLPR